MKTIRFQKLDKIAISAKCEKTKRYISRKKLARSSRIAKRSDKENNSDELHSYHYPGPPFHSPSLES